MERLLLLLTLITTVVAYTSFTLPKRSKGGITLLIHGGAGDLKKYEITREEENEYRQAMEAALHKGYDILQKGGTATEAVEAALVVMENSGLFNAGKGSVVTKEGRVEMDASIMDGATLKAGAVAGVTDVKNPVSLARAVMERTPHVMLIGKGAEDFAQQQGLEKVTPSYFKRYAADDTSGSNKGNEPLRDSKHGTVGAVALDSFGNLAAATSTGGTSNKLPGRVGDSPIIGAGNYANKICAVSCTGTGEYFMRTMAAYSVAALMEHKKWSVIKASKEVIFRQVGALKGSGGLIALDRQGNIAMEFNTSGMFRGVINAKGVRTEILK